MISAMPVDLWHRVRVAATMRGEPIHVFVRKSLERAVKVQDLQKPRETE